MCIAQIKRKDSTKGISALQKYRTAVGCEREFYHVQVKNILLKHGINSAKYEQAERNEEASQQHETLERRIMQPSDDPRKGVNDERIDWKPITVLDRGYVGYQNNLNRVDSDGHEMSTASKIQFWLRRTGVKNIEDESNDWAQWTGLLTPSRKILRLAIAAQFLSLRRTEGQLMIKVKGKSLRSAEAQNIDLHEELLRRTEAQIKTRETKIREAKIRKAKQAAIKAQIAGTNISNNEDNELVEGTFCLHWDYKCPKLYPKQGREPDTIIRKYFNEIGKSSERTNKNVNDWKVSPNRIHLVRIRLKVFNRNSKKKSTPSKYRKRANRRNFLRSRHDFQRISNTDRPKQNFDNKYGINKLYECSEAKIKPPKRKFQQERNCDVLNFTSHKDQTKGLRTEDIFFTLSAEIVSSVKYNNLNATNDGEELPQKWLYNTYITTNRGVMWELLCTASIEMIKLESVASRETESNNDENKVQATMKHQKGDLNDDIIRIEVNFLTFTTHNTILTSYEKQEQRRNMSQMEIISKHVLRAVFLIDYNKQSINNKYCDQYKLQHGVHHYANISTNKNQVGMHQNKERFILILHLLLKRGLIRKAITLKGRMHTDPRHLPQIQHDQFVIEVGTHRKLKVYRKSPHMNKTKQDDEMIDTDYTPYKKYEQFRGVGKVSKQGFQQKSNFQIYNEYRRGFNNNPRKATKFNHNHNNRLRGIEELPKGEYRYEWNCYFHHLMSYKLKINSQVKITQNETNEGNNKAIRGIWITSFGHESKALSKRNCKFYRSDGVMLIQVINMIDVNRSAESLSVFCKCYNKTRNINNGLGNNTIFMNNYDSRNHQSGITGILFKITFYGNNFHCSNIGHIEERLKRKLIITNKSDLHNKGNTISPKKADEDVSDANILEIRLLYITRYYFNLYIRSSEQEWVYTIYISLEELEWISVISAVLEDNEGWHRSRCINFCNPEASGEFWHDNVGQHIALIFGRGLSCSSDNKGKYKMIRIQEQRHKTSYDSLFTLEISVLLHHCVSYSSNEGRGLEDKVCNNSERNNKENDVDKNIIKIRTEHNWRYEPNEHNIRHSDVEWQNNILINSIMMKYHGSIIITLNEQSNSIIINYEYTMFESMQDGDNNCRDHRKFVDQVLRIVHGRIATTTGVSSKYYFRDTRKDKLAETNHCDEMKLFPDNLSSISSTCDTRKETKRKESIYKLKRLVCYVGVKIIDILTKMAFYIRHHGTIVS